MLNVKITDGNRLKISTNMYTKQYCRSKPSRISMIFFWVLMLAELNKNME